MTNLLAIINKFQVRYEINISEKHHKSKIDAPSGTAISLAQSANIEEKKIKSIREGEYGNWHKATIANDFEELEIKHSAAKRNIYAQGALNIVKWFYQKPKNLYYMQTLIEDLYE
jgi:4-hydroxy-tetrahydrodipicolinate reductase